MKKCLQHIDAIYQIEKLYVLESKPLNNMNEFKYQVSGLKKVESFRAKKCAWAINLNCVILLYLQRCITVPRTALDKKQYFF